MDLRLWFILFPLSIYSLRSDSQPVALNIEKNRVQRFENYINGIINHALEDSLKKVQAKSIPGEIGRRQKTAAHAHEISHMKYSNRQIQSSQNGLQPRKRSKLRDNSNQYFVFQLSHDLDQFENKPSVNDNQIANNQHSNNAMSSVENEVNFHGLNNPSNIASNPPLDFNDQLVNQMGTRNGKLSEGDQHNLSKPLPSVSNHIKQYKHITKTVNGKNVPNNSNKYLPSTLDKEQQQKIEHILEQGAKEIKQILDTVNKKHLSGKKNPTLSINKILRHKFDVIFQNRAQTKKEHGTRNTDITFAGKSKSEEKVEGVGHYPPSVMQRAKQEKGKNIYQILNQSKKESVLNETKVQKKEGHDTPVKLNKVDKVNDQPSNESLDVPVEKVLKKSMQRINIQPIVSGPGMNQNDLEQRQIEAPISKSIVFPQKLQDQDKMRHINLKPILTVVVNRTLSDLFKTDSILNHTTTQQDQHEHPSLHLTLVYSDYQPTNTSANPQNNTSISIPNDVESEQQIKESKRTKDIKQFFDNVVTNHFSKALKNESFGSESESIDDNEESNEIFDQTSKYETSRKSMMDEPGDVGNQFIHSHLPKELVLDGQLDKRVGDVINNQVLHLSNEINPTGNKSSVILSKMKDQDYNQKSQTGQQEKEKLFQGESGQEVKEEKVEKESSVFDNQVASQNMSSSNVSKNQNQIQKLVEHQKKDELEQPKEEDLEEGSLEEKEKKLEQREREQEEQEKLLRDREQELENKENEQKLKQQNQQKKEIELLKRKQDVLKKKQELEEQEQLEKKRKEEQLKKEKALIKRKRELLKKQMQLEQKLDQQRKEQQQREHDLNEQEEEQRRLEQKLNEQAKQQEQLEQKLNEQEKELELQAKKGKEKIQTSVASKVGEQNKKEKQSNTPPHSEVLSNESNEANTNLLPEYGEDDDKEEGDKEEGDKEDDNEEGDKEEGDETGSLQDVEKEPKTEAERKEKKDEMTNATTVGSKEKEEKSNSGNKTAVEREEKKDEMTNATAVGSKEKEEKSNSGNKTAVEREEKKDEMTNAAAVGSKEKEEKSNSGNKTAVEREEKKDEMTNVTVSSKEKEMENKTLVKHENGNENKTEGQKKPKRHVVDVANQLPDQPDTVFNQLRSEGEAVKEAFKRYGNGTIREAISEYVQGTFRKPQWEGNVLH